MPLKSAGGNLLGLCVCPCFVCSRSCFLLLFFVFDYAVGHAITQSIVLAPALAIMLLLIRTARALELSIFSIVHAIANALRLDLAIVDTIVIASA